MVKSFPWPTSKKNLHNIKNTTHFQVSANCALSAYSAFGIADLYIWLNENLGGAVGKAHWYDVFDPPYLAPKVLPLAIRLRARDHNVEILQNHGLLSKHLELEVSRLLQIQIPTKREETAQFLKFTRILDERRNENFFSFLPKDIDFI